jgi:hypothetical protein
VGNVVSKGQNVTGLFVDLRTSAVAEEWIQAGLVGAAHIIGEIGEVLEGRVQGTAL